MSSRNTATDLTNDERVRYSRHLIMPEVGVEGQRHLKAARILCIGAGGLGSPAALYLAAAGVGTIGIVDFDSVDASNLQRQILHGTKDIGRKKSDSARDRLHDANPSVNVEIHDCRLTAENAANLIANYDIVIDGSDNFPTRYLSNDVCVFARKPNIYGAVFRFDGQSSVFAPHRGGPCYRCLFPDPPPAESVPNCDQAGVLGVLPGVVGLIQAIEAIKLILGVGDPLVGRLLHFDALKMKFREFNVRRDPACPVCGEHPTIVSPIDYEQFCRTTVEMPAITVHELKQKLEAREQVQLIDVREPFEYEIVRIDGARLIPLGELSGRLDEVERSGQTIVHCHTGMRSARAVELLRQAGFDNVFNLTGGIDAWANEIDPEMERY
jgi:sulfur-carrier protein adenylyltransferase/sulfurtransferase